MTSSCVLLDVCLGQRERLDDWLELGRGLTARGLAEPRLVVGEGASGLVAAIGELWPGGDRRRCASTACATCWPSCPSSWRSTIGFGRHAVPHAPGFNVLLEQVWRSAGS